MQEFSKNSAIAETTPITLVSTSSSRLLSRFKDQWQFDPGILLIGHGIGGFSVIGGKSAEKSCDAIHQAARASARRGPQRRLRHVFYICALNVSPLESVGELTGLLTSEQPDRFHLHSSLTLVDGATFLEALGDAEPLSSHHSMAEVLIEQVEYADHVCIHYEHNSAHIGRLDVQTSLIERIHAVNTSVTILRNMAACAELTMTARKLCVHDLAAAPRWVAVMQGDAKRNSGVWEGDSWRWTSRRPLHPERFWSFMHDSQTFRTTLRCIGVFWLATRLDCVGRLIQAAGGVNYEFGGRWWGNTPRHEWPTGISRLAIDERWSEDVGDCRQEFAFISASSWGNRQDEQLEACLLTDSELADGPKIWRKLPDPFVSWESLRG